MIIALIVGGIIGWVASIIMKTNAQMGLLANIIIGIVGLFGPIHIYKYTAWLGGAFG